MAVVSSPDGNYMATVVIVQDAVSGIYVVDVTVASSAAESGDTIAVRVNGAEVWRGLATEAGG